MKKNDIQKATFQRYLEASGIIRKLFGNIQLKDMNDIAVQRKIDEYATQYHSQLVNKSQNGTS
ncbi:hypothetical protein [Bacillus paralicheniformis]|uniref:hypothetical protein n=1 Tax=Bacillus paralicheniformis TaxID=1648923 RepID=UPI001BDDE6A4|nr:hypothetical protein [Bacillus paralicheniformis]MDR9799846.1 hypothetical protein [Bacillus paralicheniformis]